MNKLLFLRIASGFMFVVGVVFLFNAGLSNAGAAIAVSSISYASSTVIGVVLILGALLIFAKVNNVNRNKSSSKK